MKKRTLPLGDKNLVGANVTQIRHNKSIKQKDLLAQMQLRGIDMNASSLSKLEGQTRPITDKELVILSEVLETPVEDLLKGSTWS